MTKIRKNLNCKECNNPNPAGKSFCSDKCYDINYKKNKKLKREANKHLRLLYNGLSKIDEIKYYINLASKVSSYKELRNLDTMPNKRSCNWLVKYCKPNWMISADEYSNRIQLEKEERDAERISEIGELSYVKQIISSEHKVGYPLKIQFECTNGHIIKRPYKYIIKEGKCSICHTQTKSVHKKKVKLLEIESQQNQKKADKLKECLERVKMVSDFIESGEYKNYDSWNQTPISYGYHWLRNGFGKEYLTNELKLELDRISYFTYKTAGARCPYPKKKGHNWCKHCETEKHENDFRRNICKQCSLQYRRDTYYEAGNIQGRINYHTNPIVKLHALVKVYVNSALKGKSKSFRTKDILGLEWDVFRDYIEGMFEPWMNWDNHGHGVGKWALQHIIPKTYAETEDDIYRLNYYKNLMPMDFSDNGALHDRILRYQLNEWHYDNCSDFLDKYKDRILESMDEIHSKPDTPNKINSAKITSSKGNKDKTIISK
jgi:predicted nucleic acid-binding Zn ribbon protein